MRIMTTHPLHFQSGHDDDDDDDDDPDDNHQHIPSITSNYHDNHDYASSAFPVGSNGTLETFF